MSSKDLAGQHEPGMIRRRLREPLTGNYVQDAVLGAVDGCVTTFDVVAAATAGGASERLIVVLGVANLLADGFSMAVSNYNAKTTLDDEIQKARRTEQYHIDRVPEGEREEIRQIFAAKGFDGETLEKVVSVITSNNAVWINTMLSEELGLQPVRISALRSSVVTFCAFLGVGFLPLGPFLLSCIPSSSKFTVSAALGAAAF